MLRKASDAYYYALLASTRDHQQQQQQQQQVHDTTAFKASILENIAHEANRTSATGGGAPKRETNAVQQLFATERNQRESKSQFIQNTLIGFDIQIMSLCAAALGYYFAYLHQFSSEHCFLISVVVYILMLLVDCGLLLIKISKEDEKTRKEGRKKERVKLKLEREAKLLNTEINAILSNNTPNEPHHNTNENNSNNEANTTEDVSNNEVSLLEKKNQ
ncbi:hypothetical protein STCU_10992 [Strigomonas culicis]|uniref:Uncharacterized protein n=1 Tax=Strigomonas culicis TaxID=28005 RepID=S9TIT4_9TRYP|nr:hypothetical protein STCU_10992 [Strigomonas culicis]|eukprot:EPY16804.1 hypothetical protein STCU_10992 [Strigomonas culicis]